MRSTEPVNERVLVVGECLVDELVSSTGEVSRHLGGSPANVALGLARLGRPVDLWTSLGADAEGHWLADELTAAGIRLVGETFAAPRTSLARGVVSADGSADWSFDLHWAPQGAPDTDGIAAVHVGSIGAVMAPGADRVWQVLRQAPTAWFRSYDVNARPSLTGTSPEVLTRVRAWLAWTDLARASVEDLAALWPGVPVNEVLAAWFSEGQRPGTVILTEGAAGLHRISRFSRELFVPPTDWPVVDTVGAGDAVTAAALDGVLRYRGELENWTLVAGQAAKAGELAVTRAGAQPPTQDELDQALAL